MCAAKGLGCNLNIRLAFATNDDGHVMALANSAQRR